MIDAPGARPAPIDGHATVAILLSVMTMGAVIVVLPVLVVTKVYGMTAPTVV